MYEYSIEKRKKNGVKKCLYLSQDVVQIAEYLAGATKSSFSACVDQIISNYYENSDPVKELKGLENEEQEIQERQTEIRQRKRLVLEKIEHHRKFKELRNREKQKAIDILIRKLIDGSEPEEIKTIALFWGNRLNIPDETLLFEASLQKKEASKKS